MTERRYVGWPTQSRNLVESAIEAHGGSARFDRVESISFSLLRLDGPLPMMKGIRQIPSRVEVFPHDHKTIFHEYPEPKQFTIFERGTVSQHSVGNSSEASIRSENHRSSFRGWAKNRRWSPIDVAYFFGYALCDYMSVPFVLPNLEFVGERQWSKSGRLHRGVIVEFPLGADTHGKRQSFFFDADGRISRHDYCAEVVGSWANGAHFWNDYVTVEGFSFPTRRNVVATVLGMATPVPVLNGALADVAVHFRAS